MKIVKVTAYPLTQILKSAQVTSQQAYRKVSICLVRIDTDEGIYGVGEALARFGAPGYAKIIDSLLAPVLIGRDPRQIKLLWDDLRKTVNGRSGGMLFEAIAAIDIALWDICAKALNLPVYALLGGKIHDRIPVYASSIMVGTDETAEADRILSLGFQRIKLKTGANVHQEINRVKRLRNHVGKDVAITVDANYIFDEYQALYFAQAVHEYDVMWFEEPIDPENREGYLRLARKSPVALAAGESEFTAHDCTDLLTSGAISFVQPDVTRLGGITESHRLAIVADAFHVKFAPHVGFSGAICVAASLHLAAAAPNLSCMECMVTPNVFRENLVEEPIGLYTQVQDSSLAIPEKPGLGISINWDYVKKLVEE